VGVMKSDTEVEFEGSRDRVFAAIVDALGDAKMKVKSSDAAAGHIEAVTGMSFQSWGEKIVIDVAEAGPGRAKATISSGNRAQLVSWGKNQKNLDKIVAGTNARLGSGATG
jgi:uncharacterized protein YjbJ (UPF0337 family)